MTRRESFSSVKNHEGLWGDRPFFFYFYLVPCLCMLPEAVLKIFGLTDPDMVIKNEAGLIHKTYFVMNPKGETRILQRLHSVVHSETCEDAHIITEYARTRGVPVPEFMLTKEGKPWFLCEGSLWRCMKSMPGHGKKILTPDAAESAAALVGQFHAVMAESGYICRVAIPHFHDAPYIFKQCLEIFDKEKGSALFGVVAKEVEQYCALLPKQFLPDDLPQQLVHGDLKISNFLFRGSRATALLDFDTCMTHTPLVDIGDALRSWCNSAGEDTEYAVFDKKIYTAVMRGYLSTASFSSAECGLVPQAFRLIALECGIRFLKDYFEDAYFGWNQKKFASRREHNLARVRGQLNLYEQIKGL